MKSISTDIANQLYSRSVRLAILAFIDHPSGETRLWSGFGTLNYDGEEWKGIGALGRINGMGETTEVRTTETQYQLAGISLDADSAAIASMPIRDRVAKAWLAFFDKEGNVLEDPILIDQTNLDVAQLLIDDDMQQVLSLTGKSAIYDFRRPAKIYVTNEQQQFEFPGDTGFDRIPTEVVDKEIKWTLT